MLSCRPAVLVLLLLFSVGLSAQNFTKPIGLPDTLSGTNFNLTLAPSTFEFFDGVATQTYGISRDYLAPTLIFNKEDRVQMNVTNNLPDTTTLHWHGMHVPPEDDGGPHTAITPGGIWNPEFEVMDDATTFWYHPHLHGKTTDHVYRGCAGMIIIRDDEEAALPLPRTYGVDDFPLIIQDKMFDASGQFIHTPFGDTMMVNGVVFPYIEVPAQRVRFRMLNASVERAYMFGISDNRTYDWIGSDGGLFPQKVTVPRTQLVAGERAELVVDFTGQAGQTVYLSSFSSELPMGLPGGPGGHGGGMMGHPPSPLDSADFHILQIRVVAANNNPSPQVPTTLVSHSPPQEVDATVFRTKVMTATANDPNLFVFDSTIFNHHHIDDTVYLGSTEVWTLINNTFIAHSFHIHDIQFYVLDINGNPPPPFYRGKKDVILLEPNDTIRFIGEFLDHADPHIPYMYHCHILPHEDAGMMGQFVVLDTTPVSVYDQLPTNEQITLYPNPTSGQVQLQWDQPQAASVLLRITDSNGRLYRQMQWQPGEELDLAFLSAGIYFVAIRSEEQWIVRKVVKQD